jgi:hypothetical protein
LTSPGFFKKYSDAIKFNRNIVIAGLAALLTSTLVSQASHESTGDLGNSAVALATEYSVYIPAFALLFYLDNRSKYVDRATGKKDTKKIRDDIKKLLASFSVAEVIFAVTRFGLHYQFLQSGSEAYVASMASSVVAWAVFFVAINLMAKLVKLFRH